MFLITKLPLLVAELLLLYHYKFLSFGSPGYCIKLNNHHKKKFELVQQILKRNKNFFVKVLRNLSVNIYDAETRNLIFLTIKNPYKFRAILKTFFSNI